MPVWVIGVDQIVEDQGKQSVPDKRGQHLTTKWSRMERIRHPVWFAQHRFNGSSMRKMKLTIVLAVERRVDCSLSKLLKDNWSQRLENC